MNSPRRPSVGLIALLGCGLLLVLCGLPSLALFVLYREDQPYRIADRREGSGGVVVQVSIRGSASQSQMRAWGQDLQQREGRSGKTFTANFYFGEPTTDSLVAQYSNGNFIALYPNLPP